ncbi:peptigoglycan-binding protein LysM, partial [Pseudomonas syringae pv. syringae FF5]
QQLTQSLEALKAQTQELQEEMSGKDKQIIALRSDLAAAQSAATPTATPAAPATVTPAPATPAVAPAAPAQPVAASGSDSFLSLPILLAAVLIVLLLVAFAYSKRRQQRKESIASAVSPDDQLIKPAQASMLPVFEVPAVAPQPVVQSPSTPAPAKPSPAQRSPGAAPDALDGVSIYIAYGRFTEAMGILRSALETQPERDDIRIRLLELLAEQGDGSGFVREEQAALEHGVDPQTIQDIRDRFPQLK